MSSFKKTFLGAFGSRLMALVRVDEVDVLSDLFRLITLSSETFKGATMHPAAKLRLNAGNWEMRAYTPLSLDAEIGQVQLLAYLHGEGPGSTWARSAVPGDRTHSLGLQPSLDIKGLTQPAVFFGDETSFAAARTLQSHPGPGNATHFIFETSDTLQAQAVADRLGLRDAQFFNRQAGDAHVAPVTEAIHRAMASVATPYLVLTGNGRSIQAVRARLRAFYSGIFDYRVKAYWAPGKAGLE